MALDLSGPRYRIEHAKRRIAEFEAELSCFYNSNPYAHVIELNADRTKQLRKFKLVKPIPPGLPGVAFDVVSSLRSALDLAGAACAVAAKTVSANAENVRAAFPFADDPTELGSRRNGTGKNIPKEIFDLMISFKPYKGGNDLLWSLNKMCNADKHRIVVPSVVHVGFEAARFGRASHPSVFHFPLVWDRKKNEVIWHSAPAEAEIDVDIKLTGYITIGDIDAMSGQPADAVFNRLSAEVIAIIDAVEAEAHRIGL